MERERARVRKLMLKLMLSLSETSQLEEPKSPLSLSLSSYFELANYPNIGICKSQKQYYVPIAPIYIS